MSTKVTKGSAAWKELEKLGANMDKATPDGDCSFFDISVDFNLLDRYGYKRIHTNSHDYTSCAYTDGNWVINMVACTGGYVSIYKLGPKAKETIDAGEVFDEFNRSLEESTSLKRIASTTEFDNGHVIFGDWKKMTDEEAEEMAKQKSIENPGKIFYVKYDDIMNPCSDIKWKNGEKVQTLAESDEDVDSESEYVEFGIDSRTGRKFGVPEDFEGEDDEWDIENNCPYDSFYESASNPVSTPDFNEGSAAEFAEKLEARIKKAFPGCKYEEIIKAHGSNETDHIYVTVASHTYEVEFNVAAQEEDIKEMGADKAAEVYAQDAIQNIEKQILFKANNPSGMPDFNRDNAAIFLDELEAKIKAGVKEFMMKPEIGFPEDEVDEYSSVSANLIGDHIEIAVGAELSYEPLSDLCDALNPIVAEYDDNSYFEPECPGRIVAYLF